jgi:hypothetical protein
MLKLTERKPKTTFWETQALSRWKGGRVLPICVAATPHNCQVKFKGCRQVFALPWTVILDKALWAHALSLKSDKVKARRRGVTRGKLS